MYSLNSGKIILDGIESIKYIDKLKETAAVDNP